MGEPVPLGRACGRCGDQFSLVVDVDGHWTDDLEALMMSSPGDRRVLRLDCDCSPPRTVAVKGIPLSEEDL
jgi:hypothetical protein